METIWYEYLRTRSSYKSPIRGNPNQYKLQNFFRKIINSGHKAKLQTQTRQSSKYSEYIYI